MAEKVSTASVAQSASASSGRRAIDWASLVPVSVDWEDSLGAEDVKRVWGKMYKLAGMSTGSESELAALRLAVYVYGAKNGTSREGNYNGYLKLANGLSVPASIIPAATGHSDIRRFFRGNAAESYGALKSSGVLEQDEKFVARAAKLNVPARSCVAICDWLGGHPSLNPEETRAHETAFAYSLARSRQSRGDRTLEDVERGRMDVSLKAQGPIDASGGEVIF